MNRIFAIIGIGMTIVGLVMVLIGNESGWILSCSGVITIFIALNGVRSDRRHQEFRKKYGLDQNDWE